MKLKAIHAIYRAEKKKQVRVEPGAVFDCPDDEAEEYLAKKAAMTVEAEKAPAKKAAAKKPTAAEKKAAAEKAAAEAGDGGEGSDDDDDELLG